MSQTTCIVCFHRYIHTSKALELAVDGDLASSFCGVNPSICLARHTSICCSNSALCLETIVDRQTNKTAVQDRISDPLESEIANETKLSNPNSQSSIVTYTSHSNEENCDSEFLDVENDLSSTMTVPLLLVP